MQLRSFLTLSLVLAGCRATVATGPGAPPPPQPEVRDHRHNEPPPPPPAPPPPVVNDHRAPPPAPPAPPPPAAPVWNSTGWVMIGSTVLDAAKKADRITVDKSVGKFDELTLVVTDGDLQLNSMKITFNNSSTFAPPVTHQFREGQRTRAIDLPGADRDHRELRAGNRLFDARREVQPTEPRVAVHELGQAGLVDRHLTAPERFDARVVDVDTRDLVAEVRESRTGHESDVARSDDGDLHGVDANRCSPPSGRSTGYFGAGPLRPQSWTWVFVPPTSVSST